MRCHRFEKVYDRLAYRCAKCGLEGDAAVTRFGAEAVVSTVRGGWASGWIKHNGNWSVAGSAWRMA